MPDTLTFHELSGPALEPWLDALGALRIRVFREYPYLYDGTLEYEREYLRTYVNAASEPGGARHGCRRTQWSARPRASHCGMKDLSSRSRFSSTAST